MSAIPDRATIELAHDRVRPWVHHTPVLTSRYFDERLGARLFFKAENFQKMGAFKFRGATNAIFSLPAAELARGVVTHSSGNHAQAVALAARNRGARATIVMPRTAPAVKLDAVRGYGGDVRLCEPTVASREALARDVLAETGGTLIHPYDDARIVAGQATAAKELLAEVPDLDLLLAPVSGGGLLSGTTLAAKYFSPGTRVVGAEPAGADDAYRSLEEGRILPSVAPKTIADGLLSSLGELPFEILRVDLEAIVTVSEEGIVEAMRRVFERMKVVVEPSAAVPLGALLEGVLPVAGLRVGVILSGGNLDLERLPWSPA